MHRGPVPPESASFHWLRAHNPGMCPTTGAVKRSDDQGESGGRRIPWSRVGKEARDAHRCGVPADRDRCRRRRGARLRPAGRGTRVPPRAGLRPRRWRGSRRCTPPGRGPTTWRPRSTSRSSCSATSPPSPRWSWSPASSSCRSGRPRWWPSRPPRWTCSPAAGSGWAIGLGWNAVEYEALGQDFTTRGRRVEEQVDLLRRLWTEPSVTYEGRFDRVTGAGLAPLPVQRPIPVWFGAQSERAYRRVGRLADGWFPQVRPGPELDEARQRGRAGRRRGGPGPGAPRHGGPGQLARRARKSWRSTPRAGATPAPATSP